MGEYYYCESKAEKTVRNMSRRGSILASFPRPSIIMVIGMIVLGSLTYEADACCYRMRVACRTSWFNACYKKAHDEFPNLYQEYTRQNFDLNNHDVWNRSVDGRYGLWKSGGNAKWYIGTWDARGKNAGQAMSNGPGRGDSSSCPLDSETDDWRYTYDDT